MKKLTKVELNHIGGGNDTQLVKTSNKPYNLIPAYLPDWRDSKSNSKAAQPKKE